MLEADRLMKIIDDLEVPDETDDSAPTPARLA